MVYLFWGVFLLLVLVGISLDLGIFNRTPRVIRTREAFAWTIFWITQALCFSLVVYYVYDNNWEGLGIMSQAETTGSEAVLLFLAGYVTEYSLSLDNVVVIALVFSYFRVPLEYQHRVLLWGVLGALVMRAIMIVAGAALIHQFEWVTYVFGLFLIVSAARMLVVEEDQLAPEKSVFLRVLERMFPLHDGFDGHKFLTVINGKKHATRLAIVLLLVESSDLIFAIDSIPAIFAITTEPFIVVTSNVFAILGLRSLYFAIAPMLERFRYLKLSLVFLLGFVGVKMLVAGHTEISPVATLSAIIGIIAIGALASLVAPKIQARSPAYLTDSEQRQLSTMSPRAARRVAGLITMSGAFLVAAAAVLLPRTGPTLFWLALLFLVGGSIGARRLIRKTQPPSEAESHASEPAERPAAGSRL